MFILNKKTKVIQECTNKDAIKCCKKDPEHYEVAATKEELLKVTASEPQGGEKENDTGRKDGEGAGDGTGNGEGAGDVKEDWQDLSDDEKEKVLNDKKVEQLREIAKAMKIPGYNNMNKGTLVAMIMNH